MAETSANTNLYFAGGNTVWKLIGNGAAAGREL
jgi:hypothetical protein